MKQVKLGVIGLGRMGQRHCRVYSNLRRVELAGVCDKDSQLGLSTAKQFEVPYFQSIQDLLENVDAVSIATPTSNHHEHVIQCIENGVHVLVEKPIAETLEQAQHLVKISQGSGLVFQVGQIERFNPAFFELANLMESMSPLAINFYRLSPSHGSNLDVDVILDLMIHDLNLLLVLVKKTITEITAMGMVVLDRLIDYASAQIRYAGGPIINLTASRVTEQKVRKIEVTCRDAFLECDLLNKNISIYRSTVDDFSVFNSKGSKYHQESVVERISVPTFEPLFLELQHFVESIIEVKPPLVTALDGFKAFELALQVRGKADPNLIRWK